MVHVYLGRPVWKKAFEGYRGGEGGKGLFGDTLVDEVIWSVQIG